MIGGEKILASREGAAEGGCGGNSAAPERSAGAKRRRVSSVQKMFEQSCIIPPMRSGGDLGLPHEVYSQRACCGDGGGTLVDGGDRHFGLSILKNEISHKINKN